MNKHQTLRFIIEHLAIMSKHNIPLNQSMIELKSHSPRAIQKLLDTWSNRLDQGIPLDQVMQELDHISQTLLKTGINTGSITQSLELICEHLHFKDNEIRQIEQATIYPAFIIILSLILFFCFETLIKPDLIALTHQQTINITQKNTTTLTTIPIFVALCAYIIYTYRHYTHQIPFIGVVIRTYIRTIWLKIILIGLENKMTIQYLYETLKQTTHHPDFTQELDWLIQHEKKGTPALESHRPKCIFETRHLQAINLGLKTDTLINQIQLLQHLEKKRLRRMIKTIETWMHPIISLLSGAWVGYLIYSVYQPMLSQIG